MTFPLEHERVLRSSLLCSSVRVHVRGAVTAIPAELLVALRLPKAATCVGAGERIRAQHSALAI